MHAARDAGPDDNASPAVSTVNRNSAVFFREVRDLSKEHASTTQKDSSTSDDLEEITRQLSALREDMAKLAQTVSGIAGRRGRGVAVDIAEGFSEATHYAERKSSSAEAQLENSFATHPLMAIGLAVGAGFVVGALSRR
jgi:ElaB/YqjD/DUF883 family membrane-anchored ribosome-binding protein